VKALKIRNKTRGLLRSEGAVQLDLNGGPPQELRLQVQLAYSLLGIGQLRCPELWEEMERGSLMARVDAEPPRPKA
jgi:DNA-binding transcriptional regulator/RsmH inhibitor MraZ